MRLDKIVKLNEIACFLEKNHIIVEKSNVGIKLVTNNNFTIFITKQSHILPDEESLIYLDCYLNFFGLPEFKRNWKKNENLTDYLVKMVIPFVVNLGGPYTVKENEIDVLIINELNEHGIKINENKRINYTCKIFNSLGNEIESIITNRPVITFHVNGIKYGINYHQASINLLVFKNDEINEIVLTYPWYSFCSVFLKGQEYVEAAVSGIIKFINQK